MSHGRHANGTMEKHMGFSQTKHDEYVRNKDYFRACGGCVTFKRLSNLHFVKRKLLCIKCRREKNNKKRLKVELGVPC